MNELILDQIGFVKICSMFGRFLFSIFRTDYNYDSDNCYDFIKFHSGDLTAVV